MFGSHFYHATLRKSVAIFGTLFNNIDVIRLDGTGGVLNQIKVPLAYGPKQKFLSRIDSKTGGDARMAIKLPRMSFEINSLEVDTTQKMAKLTKIEAPATVANKRNTIDVYTSYNIGMQLNIMAKNQDDGLQIIEQIMPYFQPEYTVTIKPIDSADWSGYKQDVPIVLNSVAIADEYEGDFVSRRVLTYTLDFTMKMKFYGPTGTTGVIKEVNIDFFDKANTANFYEGLNYEVTPRTAKAGDTQVGSSATPGSGQYKITTSMDYLKVPDNFVVTVSAPSGTFVVQEDFTASTSGTTGEISNIVLDYNNLNVVSGATLTMSVPTGYLAIGETLTGNTSGATAIVSAYSVS